MFQKSVELKSLHIAMGASHAGMPISKALLTSHFT